MGASAAQPPKDSVRSYRRRLTLLGIIIVSSAVLVWVFTAAIQYRGNNLVDNGHWRIGKIETHKDVLGVPFATTRTALHRNRLNLAAWLGFQQIIYRRPVDLARVQFDFFVPPGTYVVLTYNGTTRGFSGIRLSNNDRFASIRFRASDEGRFEQVQPLNELPIRRGGNHCRLDCRENEVQLQVNGKDVAAWTEEIKKQSLIGFRGSLHDCYIDNVEIVSADGSRSFETFRNNRRTPQIAALSLLLVLLLLATSALIVFGTTRMPRLGHQLDRFVRLAGLEIARRKRALVVAVSAILWLLLILLITHTSQDPLYFGRWSKRLLIFIVVSMAAAVAMTILAAQALRSRPFQSSWIGMLLSVTRRSMALRVLLAVAPCILVLIIARQMVKLSMAMTARVQCGVILVLLLVICLELFLWIPDTRRRLRRRPTGGTSPLARLALLHVVIAFSAVVLFSVDYWFVSLLYPPEHAIDGRGLKTFLELEQDVIRRVEENVRGDGDDEFRILVLGTSQTWGAGVARPGDEISDRLEHHLTDELGAEANIRCINAAVAGSDATRLLANYQQHWLALQPDLVVINLSFNDLDADVLIEKLADFISIGEQHDIATVFVLEPNSIEAPPGDQPEKHARMRQLARQNNIPLVDMQDYLHRVYDAGFLWWDRVHLTSLGSDLFARHLADELLERGLIHKSFEQPVE